MVENICHRPSTPFNDVDVPVPYTAAGDCHVDMVLHGSMNNNKSGVVWPPKNGIMPARTCTCRHVASEC